MHVLTLACCYVTEPELQVIAEESWQHIALLVSRCYVTVSQLCHSFSVMSQFHSYVTVNVNESMSNLRMAFFREHRRKVNKNTKYENLDIIVKSASAIADDCNDKKTVNCAKI